MCVLAQLGWHFCREYHPPPSLCLGLCPWKGCTSQPGVTFLEPLSGTRIPAEKMTETSQRDSTAVPDPAACVEPVVVNGQCEQADSQQQQQPSTESRGEGFRMDQEMKITDSIDDRGGWCQLCSRGFMRPLDRAHTVRKVTHSGESVLRICLRFNWSTYSWNAVSFCPWAFSSDFFFFFTNYAHFSLGFQWKEWDINCKINNINNSQSWIKMEQGIYELI